MRLLLDENCLLDAALALSAAGHNVLRMAEVAPAADDHAVLAPARREARTLLSFDTDFGHLNFVHGETAPPALDLLRLHPVVLDELIATTHRALNADLAGALVVATRDGLRRRPFPAVSAGE